MRVYQIIKPNILIHPHQLINNVYIDTSLD